MGDEYVSTEHLLLALAAEPRSTPAPRATSSRRRSSRCAALTA